MFVVSKRCRQEIRCEKLVFGHVWAPTVMIEATLPSLCSIPKSIPLQAMIFVLGLLLAHRGRSPSQLASQQLVARRKKAKGGKLWA